MLIMIMKSKSENFSTHWSKRSFGLISQTLSSYLIQPLVYVLFHWSIEQIITMYTKMLRCMQILDIVCHVYLFSIPTSMVNTFFLHYTKSTTTLIADMHCINHMFLVSSNNLISFDLHLVNVINLILLGIRKKISGQDYSMIALSTSHCMNR